MYGGNNFSAPDLLKTIWPRFECVLFQIGTVLAAILPIEDAMILNGKSISFNNMFTDQ